MKTFIFILLFATSFSPLAYAQDGLLTAGCDSSGQTRDLKAMLGSMKTKWSQIGEASYYGGKFNGRPTAFGYVYDVTKRTAASKKFRNECVTVRNLRTNQKAFVWANDDGPHAKDEKGKPRVIDLSPESRDAIGAGSTEQVEVLKTAENNCADIRSSVKRAPAKVSGTGRKASKKTRR